jgi:hypothetical protein
VPAEQALVQERGVPSGEDLEVRAVRVGRNMVRDQFHPGTRDRVVILLRGPLVRGDTADPAADLPGRLRHAVPPHRQEGQVDVLAVPELPDVTGNLGQDRRQVRIGRLRRGMSVVMWH